MKAQLSLALLLAVCVGSQALAKSRSAVNTVVTFSEFPVSTSITDQYSNKGIVFGGDSPFITTDGDNPTSPVLSGSPQFTGAIEGRFVNPKNGKPTTVDRFELDAGFFNANKSTRLIWYDGAGAELGRESNSELGIQHFIVNATGIARWRIQLIGSETAGYAIDNVGFNRAAAACAGVRKTIIQEYVTFHVKLTPLCENFTRTAASANYTFAELNSGDFGWALIRLPLVAAASAGFGLDAWTANIGAVHAITQGYVNPAKNATLGGDAQSAHMYGDGVDLRNVSGKKSEYKTMKAAALMAHADFVEPLTGPCGTDCVHADWRYHGGPFVN